METSVTTADVVLIINSSTIIDYGGPRGTWRPLICNNNKSFSSPDSHIQRELRCSPASKSQGTEETTEVQFNSSIGALWSFLHSCGAYFNTSKKTWHSDQVTSLVSSKCLIESSENFDPESSRIFFLAIIQHSEISFVLCFSRMLMWKGWGRWPADSYALWLVAKVWFTPLPFSPLHSPCDYHCPWQAESHVSAG